MKSKKELRDAYKQIQFKIGVYQIRNLVNGKLFIDSSPNLDKIWNRHYSELKIGGHLNKSLQSDWNEFGEDNFKFEIVSEIEQKDGESTDYVKEARALAKMFIEERQPFDDKGYNFRNA